MIETMDFLAVQSIKVLGKTVKVFHVFCFNKSFYWFLRTK